MSLITLTAFVTLLPSFAPALTVRTKSDLRLWETVMDRARPLSWVWEDCADAARLTFSNQLTHAVVHTNVVRATGTARGSCGHPAATESGEALVFATLVQTAGGVEVSREEAELAYVQRNGTVVVRTRADRDWWRVRTPRLAAFDARWWNVAGASGYEVLWKTPAGPHLVVREFAGVGTVDEVQLKFGTIGFLLLLR